VAGVPIPLRLGWRPRLLAALLFTSAITLGVAALALLSPLEQRLRASAESSLQTAVSEARAELAELQVNPETHLPEPDEVHAILGLLRRVQGAQPYLLTSRLAPAGPPFGPGDFDIPPIYPLAQQVAQTHRGSAVLRGNLYIIAKPLRIGGERYVLVVLKHLDYVANAVATVESAFIVAAAAGLGSALLIGFGLSGRLVRRLRKLRDAARALERHGPKVAIGVDEGKDEVGEVAAALRTMKERLAEQDNALRSFVATASHELRTPLASLEGLLELIDEDLRAESLDLADARQRTGRARQQARRLAKLAADLLDLSRIDSGVQLRSEPVELGELARAVAAEMELQAAGHGVVLRVRSDGRPVWAKGDPGALARILRILLDNALRVSPKEGTVEVAVERANGAAQLVVSDEGPGVDPSERELIFARFARGKAGTGAPGFGLGLAIGRELAQRMGAELKLLDRSPGAHFAVSLPADADLAGQG